MNKSCAHCGGPMPTDLTARAAAVIARSRVAATPSTPGLPVGSRRSTALRWNNGRLRPRLNVNGTSPRVAHGGSISCKPTLGMRIGAAGSKRATRTFASVGDEAVPGLVQKHGSRKLEEEAFEAEQAAFEAEEAAEAEATTDQPRFVRRDQRRKGSALWPPGPHR